MGKPRKLSSQSPLLRTIVRTIPPLSGDQLRDSSTAADGSGAAGYEAGEPIQQTQFIFRMDDSFESESSDWVSRAEWFKDGSAIGSPGPCVVVTYKDKQGAETVSCLYSGFTRYQWRLFLAAPSKGKFVHRWLYDKPYRKIG
jgi:hypothetical protein